MRLVEGASAWCGMAEPVLLGMMAVAATDGTFVPDMDMKSWAGKNKTAHPYTQQEQDMLKMAYRAAGASYDDVNRGDMDSEEPPGGNTQSPIQGFRGYPR